MLVTVAAAPNFKAGVALSIAALSCAHAQPLWNLLEVDETIATSASASTTSPSATCSDQSGL